VLASTDVYDLSDHTRTVATLEPGTWYLAKRVVGGWAHVVAGEGVEGWVGESAVNRHG
jgi:SH3-like domain-containing protein